MVESFIITLTTMNITLKEYIIILVTDFMYILKLSINNS